MFFKISVSKDEEQHLHDLDIEIIPQYYLDPAPTPIPNQKPKWAHKLIEVDGTGARHPNDRRRMRSQYHNENVALSHTASLPTEWYNKIP